MVGTFFKGWILPFLDHNAVESCQKTNLQFAKMRHQALEFHCRGDETLFWSEVKRRKKKKNQLWGNVSDADRTFWAKTGSRESRRLKQIQEVSATSHFIHLEFIFSLAPVMLHILSFHLTSFYLFFTCGFTSLHFFYIQIHYSDMNR